MLAKGAGVKPTQLRKDLTYLGQFGTRGLGYDVAELSKMISDELGTTSLQPVILIGVGITISLRTLILFPAIAVDSPGAGWTNAYQDSKGRVGLMFLIVITVAIPMIVVGWSRELLLWWAIGSSAAGPIHSILVQSVLSVLSIAAYAAVASRLYLAFGERLGRPAGLASAA